MTSSPRQAEIDAAWDRVEAEMAEWIAGLGEPEPPEVIHIHADPGDENDRRVVRAA